MLVRDEHQLGLPQWLKEHPQAYAQSLERLVQAQRQGYWQADADAQKQIAQLYQDLTRAAPLAAELPSVRRWVERAARGESVKLTPPAGMAIAAPQSPALAAPQPVPAAADLPAPPAQAEAPPSAPAVPAMGVLLERQPEQAASDSATEPSPVERIAGIVALLVMALVAMAGAAWQARRPSSLSSPSQPAGV